MKVKELLSEDLEINKHEMAWYFPVSGKKALNSTSFKDFLISEIGLSGLSSSNVTYESINVNFYLNKNFTTIETCDKLEQQLLDDYFHKLGINSDNYICNHNFKIRQDFNDFKLESKSSINLSFMNNTSMKSIHKKVLNAGELLQVGNIKAVTDSVLGLLLIPYKTMIIPPISWGSIIGKHRQSRDILECQEELITEGLRQYAKL
jgi:hypothetical protein